MLRYVFIVKKQMLANVTLTFFQWFENFVLNIIAVYQFVGAALSKIHSHRKLLQNKQMFGFLSYASFHFSYSTKLFLHFMWGLLKQEAKLSLG